MTGAAEEARLFGALGCVGASSFGGAHSAGVSIALNHSFRGDLLTSRQDFAGRVVSANVGVDGVVYRLVNVYAPNYSPVRREFVGQLATYLRGGRLLVLGGDFNFVEDRVLDKAGGDEGAGSVGSVEMGELREAYDLDDTYRSRHPAQREFSFRGGGVFTRLDRIYVSAVLLPEVRWAGLVPCLFSDHSLAGLTLRGVIGQSQGRGFCKCNVSVLEDVSVRAAVTRLWSALSGQLPKDMQWWEHCKEAFRDLLVKLSKERARERRRAFSSLQSALGLLRAHEDVSPGSFSGVIRSLEDEQEALLLGAAEGSRVRSRLLAVASEERPSNCFVRKEWQHGQDKVISELLVGGCRITGERAIAEACRSFYEELYAEEAVDGSVERFFLEGLPQLDLVDRDSLEGDLSLEVVWEALKGMRAGKSPGLDGLPKEFYSLFSICLAGTL